jgi:Outer membrane protein beta-barrel domain
MQYTLTFFSKDSGRITKTVPRMWVCLMACFLMYTSQAVAQGSGPAPGTDGQPYKLTVGATSGGAVNRFTGQPQAGLNTGYTGGLFGNYEVYRNLSLQLEGNYLQQGGQLITFKDDTRYGQEESFTTKNVKNSSYKIHSVEVPLLARYAFDVQQSWRPVVYLGGSAAFNVGVTERYQKTGDLLPGEDIIATVRGHQAVEGMFEGTRFNAIAGAGLQLPLLSKLSLLVDCRYVLGLTPARKEYSYMEKAGFGTDIRSSSFIGRIGVAFPVM